jgi:hypothetical protein
MTDMFFRVGDKVPKAGRYQCTTCGFIIEFLPQHIERGVVFSFCPVCLAGTEHGPKKFDEDIWKFIG